MSLLKTAGWRALLATAASAASLLGLGAGCGGQAPMYGPGPYLDCASDRVCEESVGLDWYCAEGTCARKPDGGT